MRGEAELVFAQESLRQAQAEIARLAPEHFREVRVTDSGFPLDIDWVLLREIERIGKLAVFTARVGGTLVGYVIHIIHTNTHRKSLLEASDDSHFLHKHWRRGWNAKHFLQFIEQTLRLLGVQKVSYHTKSHLGKSPFFEYLGYAPEDIIHEKYI